MASKQEDLLKFVSLYLRQRFTTNEVPEDECDKEAEFIFKYLDGEGVRLVVDGKLPKTRSNEAMKPNEAHYYLKGYDEALGNQVSIL